MKTKSDEAPGIDPENYILTALPKLGQGETAAHFGATLQSVVQAVRETGRKGSVTLTIEVKQRGGRGQLEVTDRISSKLPDAERGGAIFFTDELGRLLRDDPNQRKLPFGEDAADDPVPVPAKKAAK